MNLNPDPTSTSQVRVLCIEDHALVREGIAALINRQPDMKTVAEAATGRQGIDDFVRHRPDITLLDLRLPDMHGLQVLQAILDVDSAARIVVLTSSEGDVDIRRALSAGARGYLLKGTPREEFFETLRRVARGERRIPPDVAAKLAEHMGEETLTKREVEVLHLIAEGATNKDAAAQLGLSEETVKMHMRNILSKLGVDDRTGAVTVAIRRGILHL